MVEYNDVPAVNALYEEQTRLNNGIALIDAGGKVSSFTIIPPIPDPGNPAPTMMMSATIAAVDPSLSLMTACRDAMVARNIEIDAELAALGVSPAPPPPEGQAARYNPGPIGSAPPAFRHHPSPGAPR